MGYRTAMRQHAGRSNGEGRMLTHGGSVAFVRRPAWATQPETSTRIRIFQSHALHIVKEVPPWLNIANLLTLARLAVVPFAVRAILTGQHGRALAIVLPASGARPAPSCRSSARSSS
jgi:hypothetical protein